MTKLSLNSVDEKFLEYYKRVSFEILNHGNGDIGKISQDLVIR